MDGFSSGSLALYQLPDYLLVVWCGVDDPLPLIWGKLLVLETSPFDFRAIRRMYLHRQHTRRCGTSGAAERAGFRV